MRFVSVRDLRSKSTEIWRDLAAEHEMVITSNGRPIAILATVGEANVEETLAAFRKARAVDAVTALQRKAVTQGLDKLSAEDIEDEIRAVRKQRAR